MDHIKGVKSKESVEKQANEFHNLAVMLALKVAEAKKEASEYKTQLHKKETQYMELKHAYSELKENFNAIVKKNEKYEKTKAKALKAIVSIHILIEEKEERLAGAKQIPDRGGKAK